MMKARSLKENASSNINEFLYEEIISTDNNALNVRTQNALYSNMPLEIAARLFKTHHIDNSYAKLDKDYLAEAPQEELEALLDSAFNHFDTVCVEANLELEKIINAIDPSKPRAVHLEALTDAMSPDEIAKLYKKVDGAGNSIMHYSAFRRPYDFRASFNILENSLDKKDIDEIMLKENNAGEIPVNTTPSYVPAKTLIQYYQRMNDPGMIESIFKHQNENGDTILHYLYNTDIVPDLFNALQDNPEALADIMLTRNNSGYTPVTKDNTQQLLKTKIVELATDSDLSLEKSISLLRENKLEPQILKFLELQNDALKNG